jgi:hypothetical protein
VLPYLYLRPAATRATWFSAATTCARWPTTASIGYAAKTIALTCGKAATTGRRAVLLAFAGPAEIGAVSQFIVEPMTGIEPAYTAWESGSEASVASN